MSNCLKAQAASKQSMKHVMEKDKQGWLSLFSHDAVVEDPVGISPLDPTGLGKRGIEAITELLKKLVLIIYIHYMGKLIFKDRPMLEIVPPNKT